VHHQLTAVGSRVGGGLVLALLASACVGGGNVRPARGGAADRVAVDAAIAALQQAERLYEAGQNEDAAARADSLFRSWRGDPSLNALANRALLLAGRSYEAAGLLGDAADSYDTLLRREAEGPNRDEAVGRQARVLAATGRAGEAVDLVLSSPGRLDDPGLDDLRQWVSGLSTTQLRSFSSSYPPVSTEAQIVHLQLAQILAADGSSDEARDLARAVLEQRPAEPEASVAALLASLETVASGATARIGAILPSTGELSGVGALLEEGIELALDAYRADHPGGFSVELLIRDDTSNPERAADLVRDLESEGVVAIIGPLRSEAFVAAVRARRNPRLPILSPTATEVLGAEPNAYSLFDSSRRARDVAADLATWAVEELGLRRAAVLRPGDPTGAAAAAAFEGAFVAANGTVVARADYRSDTTTFQAPIEALASSNPDVVFAPISRVQTVLTLAPQLTYYGLDRSIIIGNETWADPAVLRRLEGFAADYRVVGLSADRVSAGTPWQQFVTAYERKYRKSIQDNVLPGLAHDATRLVLSALDAARLPIPAAVASRLERGVEIDGATGRLRTDGTAAGVTRTTQIRVVLGGTLRQPDRSVLLNWLAEARARPRNPDPFSRR